MKLWKYDGSGCDERFRAATASDVAEWLLEAPEKVRDTVLAPFVTERDEARAQLQWNTEAQEKLNDKRRFQLLCAAAASPGIFDAEHAAKWADAVLEAYLSRPVTNPQPQPLPAEPELAPGSRWECGAIVEPDGTRCWLGACADGIRVCCRDGDKKALPLVENVRALLARHDRGQR